MSRYYFSRSKSAKKYHRFTRAVQLNSCLDRHSYGILLGTGNGKVYFRGFIETNNNLFIVVGDFKLYNKLHDCTFYSIEMARTSCTSSLVSTSITLCFYCS